MLAWRHTGEDNDRSGDAPVHRQAGPDEWYRHIDAPEGTGGIGLIQVMQTFDNVDFHHIIANHTISGLEVVLEKYID